MRRTFYKSKLSFLRLGISSTRLSFWNSSYSMAAKQSSRILGLSSIALLLSIVLEPALCCSKGQNFAESTNYALDINEETIYRATGKKREIFYAVQLFILFWFSENIFQDLHTGCGNCRPQLVQAGCSWFCKGSGGFHWTLGILWCSQDIWGEETALISFASWSGNGSLLQPNITWCR